MKLISTPTNTAPKYKYAQEMAHITCPPPTCKPANGPAYRFVKDPYSDRCFKPIANWRKNQRDQCDAWGLSMYVTEQAARCAWEINSNKYKNMKKEFTHLAQGALSSSHGQVTEPDEDLHFDLYEQDGSDVQASFRVIGPL